MKKKALIKSKTKIEEKDGKKKTKEIVPGSFDESNPHLMKLYPKQHNHRVSLRKMSRESRKRNR